MTDPVLLKIHQALGITPQHLERNLLSFHQQPRVEELQVVDLDFEGKAFILISSTARAWREMKKAAQAEGIDLRPYSGFRSYLQQRNLIHWHLKNGRKIEDILTHIAIPGYSEHHSGRAIDIHADERAVLEENFESTKEFKWLERNASQFEFRLSYPRSNSFGIIYEPWHWFYTGS